MRFFTTFLLAIIATLSFSQSEANFGAYWNNYSLFNPSHTGLSYDVHAGYNHRYQWTGIDGSPISLSAHGETKVDGIRGAVGAGFMRESYGYTTNQTGYLTYAYHKNLSDITLFSLGTSVLLDRLVIRYADFYDENPDLPLDPSMPNSYYTKVNVNFNLGASIKIKHLELGLSSTQLREVKDEYDTRLYLRQFYAFGSYKVELSKRIQWQPTLLYKIQEGVNVFDFNNRVDIGKFLWAGVSYRSSSVISLQGGLMIKDRFQIGYINDVYLETDLYRAAGCTHEFMLSFMISDEDEE